MNIKILRLLCCVMIVTAGFTSCKKDDKPDGITIKINPYASIDNPDLDRNGDTIYVAFDYFFWGRAVLHSEYNLTNVRYEVFYDQTLQTSVQYPGINNPDFALDSVGFSVQYAVLAAFVNNITIRIIAENEKGVSATGYLVFKLQPLQYAFQFRFFDYRDHDTLSPGDTSFMSPFYIPLTPTDQIGFMNIYRKEGFKPEKLIATVHQGDFFYYQGGYLNQFSYPVPPLPPGTTVVHRFELKNLTGQLFALRYVTLVE